MRLNADGTNIHEVLEYHEKWYNEEYDENGVLPEEWRADFSGMDLRNALLPSLELYGANFRGANLYKADLTNSDLTRCDLTGCNLFYAKLENAIIHDAIGNPFIPIMCPDTGSFIGWKKALYKKADGTIDGAVIVKLRIPEDAKRTSDLRRECRASKAEILEIQTIDGEVLIDAKTKTNDCAVSIKNRITEYRVGETLVENAYEEKSNPYKNGLYSHYTNGIFFFINRKDAILYLSGGEDKNGNPISLLDEYCKQFLEKSDLDENAKQSYRKQLQEAEIWKV